MIFCFVDERFYFTDGESKEILETCEIQFKESSFFFVGQVTVYHGLQIYFLTDDGDGC